MQILLICSTYAHVSAAIRALQAVVADPSTRYQIRKTKIKVYILLVSLKQREIYMQTYTFTGARYREAEYARKLAMATGFLQMTKA